MYNISKYILGSFLFLITLLTSCTSSLSSDSVASDVSINGSLSSFAINGNSLYTINNGTLVSYDISQPHVSVTQRSTSLVDDYGASIYNMETIFPYGDHLMIGATDGMHIVDVSNENEPVYVSSYEHIVSCDPVVVQDSIAYVTLHGGTECGGVENILKVIDISDFNNPVEIGSSLMTYPLGLGVDGDLLFVCDNGMIRVIDCTDPANLNEIEQTEDIQALDVIPMANNHLIVLGDGMLNQYDYTNGNLTLLSSITNQ